MNAKETETEIEIEKRKKNSLKERTYVRAMHTHNVVVKQHLLNFNYSGVNIVLLWLLLLLLLLLFFVHLMFIAALVIFVAVELNN